MLLSSGWCPGSLSDVPYFTQRLTEVWRPKQGCHLYPDQARPAALPAFKEGWRSLGMMSRWAVSSLSEELCLFY